MTHLTVLKSMANDSAGCILPQPRSRTLY